MDRDNAKLVIIRYAMNKLSAGKSDADWFAQRDLFRPEDEIAKEGEEGAIQAASQAKAWQKVVLQRMIEGSLIKLCEADGARIAGYRVIDPDGCRRIAESDQALKWLLFPEEYDPPAWLIETRSVAPRIDETLGINVMDEMLRLLGQMLEKTLELGTTQRRIEDRLNKMDARSAENKDKNLQLIASATSDIKTATASLTKTIDAFTAQVARDGKLLQLLDERMKSFVQDTYASQDRMAKLLSLRERFESMHTNALSFLGTMDAVKTILERVGSATKNVEAAAEMAVEIIDQTEAGARHE